MTNLKDKLSASVRQAKAAQAPAQKAASAAKPAARKSTAKPAAKPAAKRALAPVEHAPTVRNPVVRDPVSAKVTVSNSPLSAKPAAKTVKVAAGGIPDSSNQLFPQRVWPD
jgi:hypothetical protein